MLQIKAPNTIKSFGRSDSGAAAVEIIFVLPFLCILYFGVMDLISLINFNKKLTQISATVSSTVAMYKNTVPEAAVNDMFNVRSIIMPPDQISAVNVDVYGYYMNGATLTQRWQKHSGAGAQCAAPRTSDLSDLMINGNDSVVTVACMDYSPWVAQFFGSLLGKDLFTLTQSVPSASNASKTLNCVKSGSSNSCT